MAKVTFDFLRRWLIYKVICAALVIAPSNHHRLRKHLLLAALDTCSPADKEIS